MSRKTSKKFATAFRASHRTAGPERSPVSRRVAASDTLVRIDLDRQCLELHVRGEVRRMWPVSTAANGPGELEGSECTPRGRHVIRAMIGAGGRATRAHYPALADGRLFARNQKELVAVDLQPDR